MPDLSDHCRMASPPGSANQRPTMAFDCALKQFPRLPSEASRTRRFCMAHG
jgi:hypothetical protein